MNADVVVAEHILRVAYMPRQLGRFGATPDSTSPLEVFIDGRPPFLLQTLSLPSNSSISRKILLLAVTSTQIP